MPVTINGQLLPPEAIEFEYRRLLQFYSEHLPPEKLKEQREILRARAKEQAIGAKLLIDEAHRLDIPVPAERVDREVRRLIHRAGGEESFRKHLIDQGYTEDILRQSIEEGCKVNLLIDQICDGLDDPTETELQAHFEAHRDEYVRPERACAQHILVKPATDAHADREVARSRLAELRLQLEDGADFGDLAEMHSDCPSGKQTAGSLGWFARGMMVPAFDDAVFAMDVDEVSDIVCSEFGFHLIHKTGHDAGGPASYADSADRIREFLRHARRGEAVAAHVAELRAKAVVEDT